MITGRSRFNIYFSLCLCLALAALAACGCSTHKDEKKKELATLRVHLEADSADLSQIVKVPIYRAAPVEITVQQEPFLTEANVASAKVVDTLGGFELQIQFNRQGTWLLQGYSANNRGKHYALFSQFGEKGKLTRWLAAPVFGRLISDGIIQFTPDCTREEADQIAEGLNTFAKENDDNQKW